VLIRVRFLSNIMFFGMHISNSYLISCEFRAITCVYLLFLSETPEVVIREIEK
jgi:hypothetical protein